jgi:hypothetical protein
MYLIFDTETTGLPKRWDAPLSDTNNWPRCVQIAWQLHDALGGVLEHRDFLVQPAGYNIPYEAESIMVSQPNWPKHKVFRLPMFWPNFRRFYKKQNL